jgi:large subunit ribosomal protein L25
MAVNTAKVSAKSRTELGSRNMKKLRDQGLLPGVVYGHKQAILPVTVNRKELTNYMNHGAHLFELDVEGKPETVLIKEAQYDHLGIHLIHVDFTRVSLTEKVKVKVPLELRGTPKGEAEGAKLQQLIAELEVECVVVSIPEIIRHSVADMEKDSVLHIKDIKLPADVRCLQDGELLVAMCREVKEEILAPVAAEGAAAAEPEVIGQKEREEKAAAEAAAKAPAGGKAPAAEKK